LVELSFFLKRSYVAEKAGFLHVQPIAKGLVALPASSGAKIGGNGRWRLKFTSTTCLTIRSSRRCFTATIFKRKCVFYCGRAATRLNSGVRLPLMHYSSIRTHLKPYVMVARRKTTINHAFAAAIAPHDAYDADRVREAMLVLGQVPEQDLLCAYCGAPAQTWDHVFAIVKDSRFSGHGHRLGNLLPCCKPCNSAKGNKDWRLYIATLNSPKQQQRVASIDAFLAKYGVTDVLPRDSHEYKRLLEIKDQVLALLTESDELAKSIRGAAI
jgi:HNH endonuclease.